VAKVNGVAVTGIPSNGQVITATSSSAASWQAPNGIPKDTIFINTADHELVLDGVTDDSAAFQTMLTTYGANKIYRFPPGANMLIKTPLTASLSNIVIEGSGRGLTTITMDTSLTGASSNALTINSSPTFETSFSLVASANIGDTAVSVSPANAATFLAGDYVLVRSNALVDTPNKHTDEVKIVKSVDATNGQVYFDDRIYSPHLLSDSATIIKVSVLKDVTVRGITFTSAQTSTPDIATATFLAQYVDGLKVEDCEWKEVWYTAVDFTSCLNSTFEGNVVNRVKTTTASATIRYGILVASATRNLTVANNHFNRCRHSVVVGTHGTTNYEGLTRDLTVVGNTSVASDTAHFDCHQPLDGGLFANNTCIGGISYLDPAASNVNGIQVRGKNVTVSGNKISHCQKGVAIQGDSLHTAQSITVCGNIINECYASRVMTYLTSSITLSSTPFTASVVDASSLAASGTIRLISTDKFTYTGKSINALTGCTSSQTTTYPAGASVSQISTDGVGVEMDSAATISGIVIIGNTIENTDSSAVLGQGAQTGVLVADNYCKNNGRINKASVQFSSTTAGPIVVRGNTIEGNVTSRTVTILGGDGHTVENNSFVSNFNQTPRVAGTNSAVRNNRGINPIAPYSLGNIAGAVTVTRVNGDHQYGTLTGNVTFTVTNGSFIGDRLILVLTQDATGSRTVTWPSNVKLANSSLTLSTAANAVDTVSLVWDGNNWRETGRALQSASTVLTQPIIKGSAVVGLTDAATIATDASTGNIFMVTLGGNRLLGNPTNPTDGQKCIWRLKQDATGSRTISLDTAFRLNTDLASITLTTTANKTDYLGAVYNGTDSTWDIIAFTRGF